MTDFTKGEEAQVAQIARIVIAEFTKEIEAHRAQAIALHLLTCPTTIKVNRMCWTTAGAVGVVLLLYRVAVAIFVP